MGVSAEPLSDEVLVALVLLCILVLLSAPEGDTGRRAKVFVPRAEPDGVFLPAALGRLWDVEPSATMSFPFPFPLLLAPVLRAPCSIIPTCSKNDSSTSISNESSS